MKADRAVVVWFTGLSGSGKTTISRALNEQLVDRRKSVHIIDGDIVRTLLHKDLGFSREDIKENNRLIAELAKAQLDNIDFILVPIISPYAEDRIMAKKIIGSNNFIELFINTPLKECIARDPKGLYKRAINGDINNFIGISDVNPYEEPTSADLEVDTSKVSLSAVVQNILNYLETLEVLEVNINE